MNLIESMQANPTAELVVTMDPGHPAYLRDSTNREKFLDGPFEHEDYQPLIDSGQLVESDEFCGVFVLSAAATPPDFSGCDLGKIYTKGDKVMELKMDNNNEQILDDDNTTEKLALQLAVINDQITFLERRHEEILVRLERSSNWDAYEIGVRIKKHGKLDEAKQWLNKLDEEFKARFMTLEG